MSLPRYPEYKESGVEWSPYVPVHWPITRTKHVAEFTTGWTPPTGDSASYDGDNLWANISDLGPKWISDTAKRISDSAVAASRIKISPKGALLFSFKLSVGQVSFAGCDMYSNEAIATFRSSSRLALAFAYYAFPIALLENAATNIYGARLLNQELIGSASFPLPQVEEQVFIAEFLDRETAKIDALVAEQERLIELLKEKRQSVVSEAVTKGLTPNAAMKDSGIEWLGEIPAHWEVRKLSQLFRAEKGKNAQMLTQAFCAENEGEYPVYSGQTENQGVMGTWSNFEFDFGDKGVLFSTTVGARAMHLRQLFGRFSLSQNCMIIWPTSEICESRFFYYQFHPLFQFQRALIPTHMQASFRIEDLYGYRIAVPPHKEQLAIASFLDLETTVLDALSTEANRAIELLQERRASLISAAVTGQIDVRPGPQKA